MTQLENTLFLYAQENLIRRMLREENAALSRTEREAEGLMEQLKALGGEAERLAKELRFQNDTVSSLLEEAAFLSGLSIGLELGRL